jgi:hypothetical protein
MTNKLEIDVWSNSGGRTGDPYIATDKFGRFRMSSGLVELLSVDGQAIKLYVGYDKANKRIALGKPDVVKPTDANPVNFDAGRHYGNARGFFEKHQLPRDFAKYVYDGKYEGWLMFKLDEYTAPDGRGNE